MVAQMTIITTIIPFMCMDVYSDALYQRIVGLLSGVVVLSRLSYARVVHYHTMIINMT